LDPVQFTDLIAGITSHIARRSLDRTLEADLNTICTPGSAVFREVQDACRAGIAEGWMCNREAGGIRYGRVVKPGAATHGFSVDVVEMRDVIGPHHRHPNGEIDLVMPLEGEALFDGRGAGWVVYEPGSAHRPTVSGGKALVLYLLPEGAIEFTRPANA
jgi:Domain of unknown function (DUF4863)